LTYSARPDGWNVTVDPRARARAVADPEIAEIRSRRSGQEINARRFIETQRYAHLILRRNLIREAMHRGEPRLVCATCDTPVYLVSTPDKAFFFRHTVEDGSCPAQTRGKWSHDEIRAMKYQGARESDAHRRIKALIARSLEADPSVSGVLLEKTWRSTTDLATYRRPDVRASFKDVRLAFEAQLSTTFLDVVVGRREFYRREGALLVWILPRFDPGDRRIMEDDILFTNNSNRRRRQDDRDVGGADGMGDEHDDEAAESAGRGDGADGARRHSPVATIARHASRKTKASAL
jgi:hypothetical protein